MVFKEPIYIFVSGGVISGLGKGITTASLATTFQSKGFNVSCLKVDMYLNQDAGTMNPIEHGEVFVTDDGIETDEDLGHYERYLGKNLSVKNYMTAGQIYRYVLEKERRLEYEGRCIEANIEIPREVIKKWESAAKGQDFFFIEMGGTVGEYQNVLFFEAARRLKIKHPGRVFFVHVVYLPIPKFLGEMKSKPAQQSVYSLNSLGIFPEFIVCRAEIEVDSRRKEKIALASSLEKDRVFSAPDVDSIYEVPLVLEKQDMSKIMFEVMGVKQKKKDLKKWKTFYARSRRAKKKIKIAIAGKYYNSGSFSLSDSYVSVVESVKHAAWSMNLKPEIVWLDSEKVEQQKNLGKSLKGVDGIIVPGGFGSRGVEGKIKVIKYAREKKIPYLGLCYGMQLATVEFARNVAGLKGANTTEIEKNNKYPVIHLMPKQEKEMLSRNYGASMRLGSWRCLLDKESISYSLYRKYGEMDRDNIISERHRHRYEFNNDFRQQLLDNGLFIAGTTTDDKLVEVVELPKSKHPFFVATQFHPEFKSRFLKPHPLFIGLMKAASEKK